MRRKDPILDYQKEKDLWVPPLLFLIVWASIFALAICISGHGTCHKRQCPDNEYPVFSKEKGCKCVPENSK